MKIPPEIHAFGEQIYIASHDRTRPMQAVVDQALGAMTSVQQKGVQSFLHELLHGAYSNADMKGIWKQVIHGHVMSAKMTNEFFKMVCERVGVVQPWVPPQSGK